MKELFICPLIIFTLVSLLSTRSPASSEKSESSDNTYPKPTMLNVSQQKPRSPQEACSYLSDIPGLQTRGYKILMGDDKYTCSSPYKEFGDGFPLKNNIAYYVSGSVSNVTELKLVLNVNNQNQSKNAREMLLDCGDALFKRALNVSMSKEVRDAITNEKAGNWNIEKSKVTLLKESWHTGKGYEMKLLIK